MGDCMLLLAESALLGALVGQLRLTARRSVNLGVSHSSLERGTRGDSPFCGEKKLWPGAWGARRNTSSPLPRPKIGGLALFARGNLGSHLPSPTHKAFRFANVYLMSSCHARSMRGMTVCTPPARWQKNAAFCWPQLFCPDLWAVTAPELAGGEGERRRSPRRDPVPGR